MGYFLELYLGGGGDDFLYDQEEHSERHQHGSGERQLLPFVRGQVEDQHGQEGEAEAGNDEEERVKEGKPLEDEGVGHKRVPVYPIPPAPFGPRGVEDLPLPVVKEVLAVHVVVHQDQVHHVAVVRPGAELHGAVLPVEGEESDVHGARGLVAGGRRPRDGPVPPHDGLGHEGALEAAVRTRRMDEGREDKRGGGVGQCRKVTRASRACMRWRRLPSVSDGAEAHA